MTDIATLRRAMVESQVQPNDVTDRRLLRAMLACPREQFAPGVDPSIAYHEGEVELTAGAPGQSGRVLLQPMLIGKLLQQARIQEQDNVLVVGCASGYVAALCASLGHSVVALESDPELAALASTTLGRLGLNAISVVTGPLPEGVAAQGPYAVIIVAGRVAEVPAALAAQLAEDGRLLSVVGHQQLARAVLTSRSGGALSSRSLFDAQAAELPGFSRKPVFAL